MIGDSQIVIDWMHGLPVPQVVMELITCKFNSVCNASVLLMHLNACPHERISYVTI